MKKFDKMTPKERMYAVFAGKEMDHYPVVSPYVFLAEADHWEELTGLPVWKHYEWLYSEPEEHVKMYGLFRQKLPFDILQPWGAPSREDREATEIIHKGGEHFIYNKRTDSYEKVPENIHNAGSNLHANEKRKVFDKSDVDEQVKITPAEVMLDRGHMDYVKKAVERYGNEQFIISGGIVNTFYMCHHYVGLTNLFALLYDEPDLIRYLSEKLLEQNIETIRALAKAGGDAIYIDDATATNDMISLDFYEKFSLPYMREEVREIKSLGMKAIVIYFGGVADRVEQILSTEPDGFMFETSMKQYVNDFETIAQQVNGRACVFGNIDPVGVVEKASDEELYEKIKEQHDIGKRYKKFVTSTGSPITPNTPVSRIRKFIEIGHSL